MDSNDCVTQKGIIEEITNGIATVNITSFSACSSCETKGACGMSEAEEKKIQVAIKPDLYKTGELVTIQMKKSLGLKATLLAYVLPFLIVIFALISLTSVGVSEFVSGISAIGVLVPYFFILHYFKGRLQNTFQFTLIK